MPDLATSAPLIALIIPAVGALLCLALGRWPNLREASTLLVSAGLALFNLTTLLPEVLSGETIRTATFEMLPGVSLGLEVEPLGMTYAVIASVLWFVTSIYSIGYMRGNDEGHQTRFYTCFAIAISASMGIAFAADLITLFIFYEVLTFSTFPLVTHKGNLEARNAGRTYLGILVSTSICLLLLGVISVAVYTPSIAFVPGGVFAESALSPVLVAAIFTLFIYGTGKAALMPVHGWLPAAMVAPTPVSALLHAVAVVKAGVFTVTKVTYYTFGIELLSQTPPAEWIAYVAGISIVLASTIALYQDNLKKRLAYSTISQLSYITLAATLFTPNAMMGALLHIAGHAFSNVYIFLASCEIYTAAHKTQVSQLDGIGRRMPVTMTVFGIASLSMIGVPPTIGFISKWTILRGAWQADALFAIAVLALSTVLNAGYFLPIVYRAFFRPPPAEDAPHGEAPWPIVLALSLSGAATVALFFRPDLFINLAQRLVGDPR